MDRGSVGRIVAAPRKDAGAGARRGTRGQATAAAALCAVVAAASAGAVPASADAVAPTARIERAASLLYVNRTVVTVVRMSGWISRNQTFVAAPGLRSDQRVRRTVGGSSADRIGRRGHCYFVEVRRLWPAHRPRPGQRFRLGAFQRTGPPNTIGTVVTVRVARGAYVRGWEDAAARRLGCG
ncbi:hypothetical protein [Patulibacter sp. SYSU D01012]|uniref:hypothetical protein n=1 Tax=Patulibacter sp. SYSU D01012 TaxID=2817381 RepID=UPI001B301A6D|nr:hypothetical protein [Patulibacter sp. SYSU D01012]